MDCDAPANGIPELEADFILLNEEYFGKRVEEVYESEEESENDNTIEDSIEESAGSPAAATATAVSATAPQELADLDMRK